MGVRPLSRVELMLWVRGVTGFQLKFHACDRLGEILAFHVCFEMGIVEIVG
jgi:hypothetical protein